MQPKNTVPAILDALAAQERRGETSLTIRIQPDLIQDVMKIPGYRKLFAPVTPGVSDPAAIYAAYEQMQQGVEARHIILVLVVCETIAEFHEALDRMPMRKSAEWRNLPTTGFDTSD